MASLLLPQDKPPYSTFPAPVTGHEMEVLSSFTTPPTRRLTVSSLLSPPETKRSDSFSSPATPSLTLDCSPSQPRPAAVVAAVSGYQDDMARTKTVRPHHTVYASPPISPSHSQPQKEITHMVAEQAVRDPPLFIPGNPVDSVAHVPLFLVEASDPASQDAIGEHMKSNGYAQLQSKPSRADYELAVSFRSTVFDLATKNSRKWWAQERQFDLHYGRPAGVQKRPPLKKLAPAPSSRPRQPKMALPRMPLRAPRVPKAKPTPKAQTHHAFELPPMSASPKSARPTAHRDDTDYHALPDCSPPLATLPAGNGKSLKAEWKGNSLDLNDDPDRHLLHEAEINLAATLRLSCATYLCSKRRVFQARVEALKIGKEFRKTDAQQACKIDVNKASKLWQAYDRVGWFHPQYFQHHL